jgi:hypothetical protein
MAKGFIHHLFALPIGVIGYTTGVDHIQIGTFMKLLSFKTIFFQLLRNGTTFRKIQFTAEGI